MLDAIVNRCLTHVGNAEGAPRARGLGSILVAVSAPLMAIVTTTPMGLKALMWCYAPLKLVTVPLVLLLPMACYQSRRPTKREPPATMRPR